MTINLTLDEFIEIVTAALQERYGSIGKVTGFDLVSRYSDGKGEYRLIEEHAWHSEPDYVEVAFENEGYPLPKDFDKARGVRVSWSQDLWENDVESNRPTETGVYLVCDKVGDRHDVLFYDADAEAWRQLTCPVEPSKVAYWREIGSFGAMQQIIRDFRWRAGSMPPKESGQYIVVDEDDNYRLMGYSEHEGWFDLYIRGNTIKAWRKLPKFGEKG